MNKEIIFLRVTNSQEKLSALLNTTRHHFFQNQKILIACPSEQVANYIDNLLWSEPKISFLPHSIKNEPAEDFILLSWMKNNFNKASILINLCNDFHPHFEQFETVYELYDETHPVKEELSKAKNSHYQTQGFKTLIRSLKQRDSLL